MTLCMMLCEARKQRTRDYVKIENLLIIVEVLAMGPPIRGMSSRCMRLGAPPSKLRAEYAKRIEYASWCLHVHDAKMI